ncbi:MAG TPA: UvrD-helicase domain-containing protein, partial [Bacteroidales bacterium]|nr:UvrD-helicase domain-containing protein [Bacteroidales bacterium]
MSTETHTDPLPFNALTVPLQGTNLIEASAGTGKTYSIALMVLRLVLEQGRPLREILMVTFTNAAVAELEVRIRLFIRRAYQYACRGRADIDSNIKAIVDNAIAQGGLPEKTVRERIVAAFNALDETQIMTIHGFCTDVLQTYAFETEQAFKSEILTDQTLWITRICNTFWREEITTLEADLLQSLVYEGKPTFDKDGLTGFVNGLLDGKVFIPREGDRLALPDLTVALKESLERKNNAYQAFEEYVEREYDHLCDAAQGNYHARNLVAGCKGPADFVSAFESKWEKQYAATCFPGAVDLFSKYVQLAASWENLRLDYLEYLYLKLQDRAVADMERLKTRKNVLGYADLIHKVWLAVKAGRVQGVLADKYKALFIDEFQDTDQKQYEIFSSLVADPVFYIGDPRQSIFGWRQADLNTYKKARDGVQHVYTMNCNFRSTPRMVTALNHFFSIGDPFLDEGIGYIDVKAVEGKRELQWDMQPVTPLILYECSNQDKVIAYTADCVVTWLTDSKYQIPDGKEGYRRIKPSDIGVIVRDNKQGKKIKRELSSRNVPAVILTDALVWSAEEALHIYYVLWAVLYPNRNSISRALLNPYFGFGTEQVVQMDDQKELARFRELKEKWEEEGIYSALSAFLRMYRVRDCCSVEDNMEGQRAITNYLHLTELLHKVQMQKDLGPEELLSWIARKIEEPAGTATTDSVSGTDAHVQRIESDENAVNITTIHKCKGLSYPIVAAPFLDMTWKDKLTMLNFRMPEKGNYVTAIKRGGTYEETAKMQSAQEDRRLIYVAMTRAVYHCTLCSRSEKNSLQPFVHQVKENPRWWIQLESEKPQEQRKWLKKEQKEAFAETGTFESRNPSGVPPMPTGWCVESFSSLVKHLPPVSEEDLAVAVSLLATDAKAAADVVGPALSASAYDTFIFERLPKGIKTGL